MLQTLINFLICLSAVCVVYYLISLFHIHRWNSWKIYKDKVSTRQYRTCKGCNKTEDAMVSYLTVLPLEILQEEKSNVR
jgi:hypothetical protein